MRACVCVCVCVCVLGGLFLGGESEGSPFFILLLLVYFFFNILQYIYLNPFYERPFFNLYIDYEREMRGFEGGLRDFLSSIFFILTAFFFIMFLFFC